MCIAFVNINTRNLLLGKTSKRSTKKELVSNQSNQAYMYQQASLKECGANDKYMASKIDQVCRPEAVTDNYIAEPVEVEFTASQNTASQ